jgi:hypothetical protein
MVSLCWCRNGRQQTLGLMLWACFLVWCLYSLFSHMLHLFQICPPQYFSLSPISDDRIMPITLLENPGIFKIPRLNFFLVKCILACVEGVHSYLRLFLTVVIVCPLLLVSYMLLDISALQISCVCQTSYT